MLLRHSDSKKEGESKNISNSYANDVNPILL